MRAPDWRWGFERRSSPSFWRGAHARVPTGRFQLRPLVDLGDGGRGQAQGGDAGAGAGARRQGAQVHVAAPVVEQPPLGAVDAPGVVGEDGPQGVGHAPVGVPQG